MKQKVLDFISRITVDEYPNLTHAQRVSAFKDIYEIYEQRLNMNGYQNMIDSMGNMEYNNLHVLCVYDIFISRGVYSNIVKKWVDRVCSVNPEDNGFMIELYNSRPDLFK